jgi:hypothetical protein
MQGNSLRRLAIMKKQVFLVFMVLAALAVGLALTPQTVWAAAGAAGGAGLKDLAGKEGVTLGQKKWDQDKLPGKYQIGFAVGSFVAMVIVIKYL